MSDVGIEYFKNNLGFIEGNIVNGDFFFKRIFFFLCTFYFPQLLCLNLISFRLLGESSLTKHIHMYLTWFDWCDVSIDFPWI